MAYFSFLILILYAYSSSFFHCTFDNKGHVTVNREVNGFLLNHDKNKSNKYVHIYDFNYQIKIAI